MLLNSGGTSEQCIKAVDYWGSKWSEEKGKARGYAIDRLRVFIEVLARVTVRATPEQSKKIFRLACMLGGRAEFHHFWLFDALKHLFKCALKSIPVSEHHELLLDALFFPLQREIGVRDYPEWPNPVIKFPGIRGKNPILSRRIDEIIDHIAPCSAESAPAILRLLPLLENGFLTDDERQKMSEKVWGSAPDYQTLPEIGLLKFVFLQLPAQTPSAVRGLVRHYLFEAEGDSLFAHARLMDIANAACVEQAKELPSEDEATKYFERLVAWRPNQNEKDPFGFSDQEEQRKAVSISLVRAACITIARDILSESNDKNTELLRVLENAKLDALPEIRFAEVTDK